MKTVEISGEQFFIRKFTVKEYLRAGFSQGNEESGLVGALVLGLANEDGSRKYPAGETEITDEAKESVMSMPMGTASQLVQEITDYNDLEAKPKKSA